MNRAGSSGAEGEGPRQRVDSPAHLSDWEGKNREALVGWLRLAREGRLVLASSSPRRAGLLDMLGVPYIVHSSGIPEDDDGSAPAEWAERLAEAKAVEVAKAHPNGLVLAGDTEVVLDGRALGKPSCPRDAHRMLLELRGRTHEVITALHLIDGPTGLSRSGLERTLVTMREFSVAEGAFYAYSGDPMDKAGAYGIQSFASVLVERIEGCYYNVVGLPLSRLVSMMEDLWREIREMNG